MWNFVGLQVMQLVWAFTAPLKAMRHLRRSSRPGLLHPLIVEQLLIPIPIPLGVVLLLLLAPQAEWGIRVSAVGGALGRGEWLAYAVLFVFVVVSSAIIPRCFAGVLVQLGVPDRQKATAEQIYLMFFSFLPFYVSPVLGEASARWLAAYYALCFIWMSFSGSIINIMYYEKRRNLAPEIPRRIIIMHVLAMAGLAAMSIGLVILTLRIEAPLSTPLDLGHARGDALTP